MTEDTAGREPLTRPLGFRAETAVIERIGERDLFLGNALAADPESHDRAFDSVVSVSEDAYPLTTHHRPMVDGYEVRWDRFSAAVDTAREQYRREGSLLVHCEAGVSRSSTVLATTLAAEEGIPLAAGVDAVRAARPIATPHPGVYEMAVCYLAAAGH